MKTKAAWLGWPGSGTAPGHDWLPGPKLRCTVLLLVYAFLALALTVDYAASVTFFVLAIVGLYVGLRRGFVSGLTRFEKVAMLVFAAYPAIAVVSYLLGTQTNVGFRFLGRDVRLLFFIPVYLAIRWSRPTTKGAGWALAGGAVGAAVLAIVQSHPWPAPLVHGVAGTHIVFGDLALATGFLAATLLWFDRRQRTAVARWQALATVLAATAAIAAGIAASVLARARGGWPAVPVLAALLLATMPVAWRMKRAARASLAAACVVVLLAAAWAMTPVRQQVFRAVKDLSAYAAVANTRSVDSLCVDRQDFLKALLGHSRVRGPGSVGLRRLSERERREVSAFGCKGSYALIITNSPENHKSVNLQIYRGTGAARMRRQSVTILARGRGRFDVGWGNAWIRMLPSDGWREYRVTRQDKRLRPANLSVGPGDKLTVIPIQKPRGAFAFPLAESSAGRRLEMWRAAWSLFLSHPAWGAGTGSFQALGRRVLAHSPLAVLVGDYEHAHSDYLTTLGTKGAVGFLELLALLATPLVVAMRAERGAKTVSVAPEVTFTVVFVIFGLTETMFSHSLVITWFCLVAATLIGIRASGGAVAGASSGATGERPGVGPG